MAIFVASDIFLQSINQKRAETVVVNDTQSLTKVRGVEPVTSSHWARDGPPINDIRIGLHTINRSIFLFQIDRG